MRLSVAMLIVFVASCHAFGGIFPDPNECENGVRHKTSCYFSLSQRDQYGDAIRSCKVKGGHLAFIEDQVTYDIVVRFLRKQVARTGRNKASFWTGQLYNQFGDGQVITSKGRELEWVAAMWYPRFPMADYEEWSYVALHVKVQAQNVKQGFFNHPKEANMHPLCHKWLKVH